MLLENKLNLVFYCLHNGNSVWGTAVQNIVRGKFTIRTDKTKRNEPVRFTSIYSLIIQLLVPNCGLHGISLHPSLVGLRNNNGKCIMYQELVNKDDKREDGRFRVDPAGTE